MWVQCCDYLLLFCVLCLKLSFHNRYSFKEKLAVMISKRTQQQINTSHIGLLCFLITQNMSMKANFYLGTLFLAKVSIEVHLLAFYVLSNASSSSTTDEMQLKSQYLNCTHKLKPCLQIKMAMHMYTQNLSLFMFAGLLAWLFCFIHKVMPMPGLISNDRWELFKNINNLFTYLITLSETLFITLCKKLQPHFQKC